MSVGVAQLRRALVRPVPLASLAWLVLISVACALAPVIAPHDPLEQDLAGALAGPGAGHLLGTDELGRDMLSRLLHGGGGLLTTALVPVAISLLIGVPVGLLAGYARGRIDDAASFVVDILFAIPGLVVVLAVAAVSGNDLILMAAVFGVITSGGIYRVVRAATSSTRDLLYVDAARLAGLSRRRILARHVLPNVAGPLVVQAFVQYSGTFLFLTSLSFLGLGFSPETPSWGQLTQDATQHLYDHPWLMVPIGFVLTATVLALNLVGATVLRALTGHQRPALLPPRRAAERMPVAGRSDAGRAGTEHDAALVIDGLRVTFPGTDGAERPVVDGVTLELRRGEAFGLVGESGSGKTTTALAVLGLVPPPGRITAGRVLLEGEDLLGLGEAQMEKVRGDRIGLVSQEPMVALDPCFTVGSQLREPLRFRHGMRRRAARERSVDLLRFVGIPNPELVARRYPHQLSGGMAQRVAIALALAGQPRLLVADEPTSALDVTVQGEILDLLRGLQRDLRMTLLLVTHDLGVIADICDRVAVMCDGRVVEQGSAETVLAAPEHPYTQTLVRSTPELDDDRNGLLAGTQP